MILLTSFTYKEFIFQRKSLQIILGKVDYTAKIFCLLSVSFLQKPTHHILLKSLHFFLFTTLEIPHFKLTDIQKTATLQSLARQISLK